MGRLSRTGGGGRPGPGVRLVLCSCALLVLCAFLIDGSDGAGLRENAMKTAPPVSLESQERAEAFRFLRSRSELRETTANELDSDDDEDDDQDSADSQSESQAGTPAEKEQEEKDEMANVEPKSEKAKEAKEMAEEEAAENDDDDDDDDATQKPTEASGKTAPKGDEAKGKKAAGKEDDSAEDGGSDDEQALGSGSGSAKASVPGVSGPEKTKEAGAVEDDVAVAEQEGSEPKTDVKTAKKKVAKALLGKIGIQLGGNRGAKAPTKEKETVADDDGEDEELEEEAKSASGAAGTSGSNSGAGAKDQQESDDQKNDGDGADEDVVVGQPEEQGSEKTDGAKESSGPATGSKAATAASGPNGDETNTNVEEEEEDDDDVVVAKAEEQGSKKTAHAKGSSGTATGSNASPEATAASGPNTDSDDGEDDDDVVVAKAEEEGSKKTAPVTASSGAASSFKASAAATAASGPSRDEADINADDEEDDDDVEPDTTGGPTGSAQSRNNSAHTTRSKKMSSSSGAATGTVSIQTTSAAPKSAATGVFAKANGAKMPTGMTGTRQPKGPVVTGSTAYAQSPNSTKKPTSPASTGVEDDDDDDDVPEEAQKAPAATGGTPTNSTKKHVSLAATGAAENKTAKTEPNKPAATGMAPVNGTKMVAVNSSKKSAAKTALDELDGEDDEEEKENAVRNMTIDGIPMKETNKLNSELPSNDKFLNGSDMLDAIADTAVTEDQDVGSTGSTGMAAMTGDDYSQVSKAMLRPTKTEEEYEPVHIKEEGGTVLVHKLTRQPLLESPIVLPTIQHVESLKEIDSVRTPLDHVPANYNGKALSVLLHRQDEAQLQQLPVRKISELSTEGKSQDDLAKEALKWRDLGQKYTALANEAESSVKGSSTKSAPEIIEEQKKSPTASMVDAVTIIPRTPRLRKVVRKAGDTYKQVENDADLGLFGHEQQV